MNQQSFPIGSLDAKKENPQSAVTDCRQEVSTDTQSTTIGATEDATQ